MEGAREGAERAMNKYSQLATAGRSIRISMECVGGGERMVLEGISTKSYCRQIFF